MGSTATDIRSGEIAASSEQNSRGRHVIGLPHSSAPRGEAIPLPGRPLHRAARRRLHARRLEGPVRQVPVLHLPGVVEHVVCGVAEQVRDRPVHFRIVRVLATHAVSLRLGLLGRGRSETFAELRFSSGPTVEVRYQRRPVDAKADLLAPVLEHYDLPASAGTPDIVVERTTTPLRRMLIEVKHSNSVSYLAEGMYQLFGYVEASASPRPRRAFSLRHSPRSADRGRRVRRR
jgi:hypothetical protein